MKSLDMYIKGYTFYEICKILNISNEELIQDFKQFNKSMYDTHEKNLKERINNFLKEKTLGEIAVELNISTKYIKKIIEK